MLYSSRGRPTSWIPIGRPLLVLARGRLIAGWPVQLNGCVKLSQSRNSSDAVSRFLPSVPSLGAGPVSVGVSSTSMSSHQAISSRACWCSWVSVFKYSTELVDGATSNISRFSGSSSSVCWMGRAPTAVTASTWIRGRNFVRSGRTRRIRCPRRGSSCAVDLTAAVTAAAGGRGGGEGAAPAPAGQSRTGPAGGGGGGTAAGTAGCPRGIDRVPRRREHRSFGDRTRAELRRVGLSQNDGAFLLQACNGKAVDLGNRVFKHARGQAVAITG